MALGASGPQTPSITMPDEISTYSTVTDSDTVTPSVVRTPLDSDQQDKIGDTQPELLTSCRSSLRSGHPSLNATEFELGLRRDVSRTGHMAHVQDGRGDPEKGGVGVIEKRVVVDLGNGPEEVVIVDWLPNDPENPIHWHPARKYAMVVITLTITALTAINATSVGILATWGEDWFHTTHLKFTLSITLYLLAIAFAPLVLAPLSETFGRNGIYQITTILTALLFIPQALSRNFAGFLVARFFQGAVSSVGNSMVGGTIADLFEAKNRGMAMNVFAWFTYTGQSLGGVLMGWIGMKLGMRWVYGIQAILGGLMVLINALFLRETRADVLLSWKAKRLTKETGQKHICPADLERRSLKELISVSITRPVEYLVTEPIVSAISLWIGFNWGCIFLGTTSILLVFAQYGWNPGLQGTAMASLFVAGCLGFLSNLHQDHLYRRARQRSATGRAAPEARLYWACAGALMFPAGMYAFGWTGQPQVPWIVPMIFLCIALWGVNAMYSGVYNYMADAYETYSSSAQASHSFVRNICSATFPLFAKTMYVSLGYPVASTVVASISLGLAVAPLLIFKYGARLRAKSKVASALAQNY